MKQNLQPSALAAELIAAGYEQALALLRRNATPAGILAASNTEAARKRHYATIFGRDAAISALGMVASGEADLVACARAGLLTLARSQAANGQIPNYVDPAGGEVDFWYTGCIDATLWWLIAVAGFERLAPGAGLGRELAPQVARARHWLACQEHPQWRLLQQNEASDWADIMPRSGFVLYSNALWFWVKRLYGEPDAERDPGGRQPPLSSLRRTAPGGAAAAAADRPDPRAGRALPLLPQLRQPLRLGGGGGPVRQPPRPVHRPGRSRAWRADGRCRPGAGGAPPLPAAGGRHPDRTGGPAVASLHAAPPAESSLAVPQWRHLALHRRFLGPGPASASAGRSSPGRNWNPSPAPIASATGHSTNGSRGTAAAPWG